MAIFSNPKPKKEKFRASHLIYLFVALLLIAGLLYYGTAFLPVVTVLFIAFSFIFIVLTMRIQIQRYRAEKKMHNLYPLVAYIFLMFYTFFMVLYRLPELDIVLLQTLTLDYNVAWQMTLFFAFLGFLFLAFWAWSFIKVRPFLRTFAAFFSIAVVVSALGALVFTLLIFNILERNNLELMAQGANTEELVLLERLDSSMFVAQTIAYDERLANYTAENNRAMLDDRAEAYLKSADLDVMRVYNKYGEVMTSPGDQRERGQVYNSDPYVMFAITEASLVKTFDTKSGVLADVVIARSIHPIMRGDVVVGAVEAGYAFDNAFADFLKEQSGLDITLYVAATRSATTIPTLDGVSRWVGSQETEQEVLTNVLQEGRSHRMIVDRLGREYYSAFEPIRNINGEIIGMLAVGTPFDILFEDTRQQMLTTFLIVTVLSLLVALVGVAIMRSYRQQPITID